MAASLNVVTASQGILTVIMKLGKTNASRCRLSLSKWPGCQLRRLSLKKVVEVCDERLRQLEDCIVALGLEVPRPHSLQSEALLSEIRAGMKAGQDGENAAKDQDPDFGLDRNRNSFSLTGDSPSAPLPPTDLASSQPHDVQHGHRNDEAVWDSGQDSGAQWLMPTAQPLQATEFKDDFEMPYIADYSMPFPNAIDLPWNGFHEDPFLQSITAVDQSLMEMPQHTANPPNAPWDTIAPGDDPGATTDDDSDNEIIEQLSLRLGDLYLVDDGTFRYLGATSNMTLAQDWSFRENMTRQRSLKEVNDLTTAPELDEDLNCHLENLYFHWQNPFLHIVDREIFNHSKDQTRAGGKSGFYSDALKFAMYSHYMHRY